MDIPSPHQDSVTGDELARPAGSVLNPQIAPPSRNHIPAHNPQMATTPQSDGAGTRPRFKGLQKVIGKLSGTFRPAKDKHKDSSREPHDDAVLRGQLEALLADMDVRFSGANVSTLMAASIEKLCNAIKAELEHISNHETQIGNQRSEPQKDPGGVIESYRRMYKHLEFLALNAGISALQIADEQATETRFKSLAPSRSAYYNSAEASSLLRRECTPGTRKQVIADIDRWRCDQNLGNLYWLNGMAGTGKTTIANTLCAMLDTLGDLAASFFCTRQRPECRNVKLILPTIAYQLARFSPGFRVALSQVLENDPDVYTRALPNQFEGMIAGPLRKVTDVLGPGLLVVIDALDECDQSNEVLQMLEVLAKHASELPIKVFVSSRPEPQIRQKLDATRSKFVLHELESSIVKEDIKTYLQAELATMLLSESQLAGLVERAGVLFIYAATVVRYIGAENFSLDPESRLEDVLESTSVSSIDTLYNTILDSAFQNPNLLPRDKERMRTVLHTVVCAQEPLTVNSLTGLLQLNDAALVHGALRPLWSVLHITGANDLVTTLHASFPDYMLDAHRSKVHTCKAETHHEQLTRLCFARIKSNKPQFNICGLELSYLLDIDIPNIEARIGDAIPPDLTYSCQHWAAHLKLGPKSPECVPLLDEFLSTQLLLWMEVLNLKNLMKVGPTLLDKARMWCTAVACSQKLKDLVQDAFRFTKVFATNPVSRSTPHIYVSMLASWPTSRPVTLSYRQRARELVHIGGTGITRRRLALISRIAIGSCISSVAYSPNGAYIASGSDDGEVHIWDAQSCRLVLGPLLGLGGNVHSVAYSPDGMRIAGCADGTLCIWDTQSGRVVLAPPQGHTGAIHSVAFSPDDTCIVSGSGDGTIRMWDAHNGEMEYLFEEHDEAALSVVFSPDSTRIVSGSRDGTIYMWDADNGEMIDLLGEHSGAVHSVAFSPDGTRVASGSDDMTVCVWDVRSREMILGPRKGHDESVNSVAFSPDGMRIVSGADDWTVRVWSAQNGQIVLGPLEGHDGDINSVAFSPDGTNIVSGSDDGTICLWDAQNTLDQAALGPLEGHTNMIDSVAFSHNGMYIASGSEDRGIRVWDAQGGHMVLGPLGGHTAGVTSVAFSPNDTRIFSASDDKTIRMWDAQSGEMLNLLEGHTMHVYSIAFSPHGMLIASGSGDRTIRMWDAQSGEMILGPLKGNTGKVLSVAFSPDGARFVSGSDDTTIGVWNAQSGRLIGRLKGHTGAVRSVAFSPDGTRIVSGSGSMDCTVRVWDAQCGQVMPSPLRGHTNEVNGVAFSPHGLHIASCSTDSTIRLWDAQSGDIVLLLEGNGSPVTSVAFSPDGTDIAAGLDDGSIWMWRVPECQPTSDDTSPSSPRHTPIADPVVDNHTPPQSSITSSSPSSSSALWQLDDDDGWVSKGDCLLLWVPPDMRSRLLRPRNTFMISTEGSIHLDFKGANIGERWTECYAPA